MRFPEAEGAGDPPSPGWLTSRGPGSDRAQTSSQADLPLLSSTPNTGIPGPFVSELLQILKKAPHPGLSQPP